MPVLFNQVSLDQDALRRAITSAYLMEEAKAAAVLIEAAEGSPQERNQAERLAIELIEAVRKEGSKRSGIEAFMYHYDLSCEEGVLLMCLAEALLRIPDKETERLLIEDKLTSAHWEKHLGASESSFVNAATWGLAFTGKLLDKSRSDGNYIQSLWQRMIQKSGEPIIRKAVREVMKVLTQQFVVGRTIEEALSRSKKLIKQGYCYSYDMLGEAARTEVDAEAYFIAYQKAIAAIASNKKAEEDVFAAPGISVKLSALHPRYEFSKQESVVPILIDRLKVLALQAKVANIGLIVDAEESYRLDISLDIIERVFTDPELSGWEGLGLAIQAYQKRCFYLIDWLVDLSRRQGKRLQVRLVKGAYWDSEIKWAQVDGYVDYPVFTRKITTDVSYLACAKKLLAANQHIYPQFATHNAFSVARILTMMGEDLHRYHFEFQNLQGMGKALHDTLVSKKTFHLRSRIYAPVGVHEDLLPYLVRRLLENGANSSFVNKVADEHMPIERLAEDPVMRLKTLEPKRNPKIVLPKDLYGSGRTNAAGVTLSDYQTLKTLEAGLQKAQKKTDRDTQLSGDEKKVQSPANHNWIVGSLKRATPADVERALQAAHQAFPTWRQKSVEERAHLLRKTGDLLEIHRDELMWLAIREAGKTIVDAVAEIREAVDFCRYYAEQGELSLRSRFLPGPTGETNELILQGRGVVACISPWNFPAAIFCGQVSAALMAGNTVIAKPSGQTELMGMRLVEIMHEAGVPRDVVQALPGLGSVVGAQLVADERIAAVMFTGSTETAKGIQRALAARSGPIVPFIAETGGMNALIADSSALHEQLVDDVIRSAFGSAGQRCSALRLLCLQEEMAEPVITMLRGAMAALQLGDPVLLATDVGPVIDKASFDMLKNYCEEMAQKTELIYRVDVSHLSHEGYFFPPHAFLLKNAQEMTREIFGPVLHVLVYKQSQLMEMVDAINAYGFGLTFGIQSRINETVKQVSNRIEAGNVYVNRNMIGAVVGVQPFGGRHLSGTGPKAGGPHYLQRLCDEKTITINTTAAGGNASLMALGE